MTRWNPLFEVELNRSGFVEAPTPEKVEPS